MVIGGFADLEDRSDSISFLFVCNPDLLDLFACSKCLLAKRSISRPPLGQLMVLFIGPSLSWKEVHEVCA